MEGAEGLVGRMRLPGPSINGVKSSDLEWVEGAEGLVGRMHLPGPSKNGRESSDLDGRRVR